MLQTIADSIGQKYGTQPPSLKRVDDAVRAGGRLNMFGKSEDISAPIEMGKVKAREFVAAMANRVGDGADIDNIILSGGGSEFCCASARHRCRGRRWPLDGLRAGALSARRRTAHSIGNCHAPQTRAVYAAQEGNP